jgi:hypothetical protein
MPLYLARFIAIKNGIAVTCHINIDSDNSHCPVTI